MIFLHPLKIQQHFSVQSFFFIIFGLKEGTHIYKKIFKKFITSKISMVAFKGTQHKYLSLSGVPPTQRTKHRG